MDHHRFITWKERLFETTALAVTMGGSFYGQVSIFGPLASALAVGGCAFFGLLDYARTKRTPLYKILAHFPFKTRLLPPDNPTSVFVREAAVKMGVPTPVNVYGVSTFEPDAILRSDTFKVVLLKNESQRCLLTPDLAELSADKPVIAANRSIVKAMVHHELAHLKVDTHSFLTMFFCESVTKKSLDLLCCASLLNGGCNLVAGAAGDQATLFPEVGFAAGGLTAAFGIAARLGFLYTRRLWEARADRNAVAFCPDYPSQLARLLSADPAEVGNPPYGVYKSIVMAFFSTHPSLSQRRRALEKTYRERPCL